MHCDRETWEVLKSEKAQREEIKTGIKLSDFITHSRLRFPMETLDFQRQSEIDFTTFIAED